MTLAGNPFTALCTAVKELLKSELDAVGNDILVLLGTPSEAERADATKQRVNVFVYGVEPWPFGPPPGPTETALLRVCLLITPFGIREGERTAGTSELVLLGEAVRALHEHPVIEADDPVLGRVHAEVTPAPIGLAELNYLWSLQRDVPFHPSAAYRLALAPIVPRASRPGAPLVGEVRTEVRPVGGTGGEVPGWAPEISFSTAAGPAKTAQVQAGTAGKWQVLVSGKAGATVELCWEIWQPDTGWRTPDMPPQQVTCVGESPSPGQAVPVALAVPGQPGQAVLYAVRQVTVPGGGQLHIRSNLLLVTVTGSPP